MKPKLSKRSSLKDHPYRVFSRDKKSLLFRKTLIDFPESSNLDIFNNNKAHFRPKTAGNRPTSPTLSISKSLKVMTLNSKLYSNYIDFYSNLTKQNSFKTLRLKKHPFLMSTEYSSIKYQTSTENKEKIPIAPEITKSVFLSYMRESKSVKKFEGKKNKESKYDTFRTKFDRPKTSNSYRAGKNFGELCDINLFESEFLKKAGLKSIDMDNCSEEKQKNFKVLYDFLKRADGLRDIFNENNSYRNIIFNGKTAIKKEKMDFNLNIYSLCLKFFLIGSNNKEKKSQKLYFPFELMPLFYLLDFTSFKVFLSEIIIFNKYNNCFEYIKENLIIKKVKKYFDYISNSVETKHKYINNITYNKKETMFPLIYDWIVTKNYMNEDEEQDNINNNLNNNFNDDYKCFKLKIVLPKIKFSVDNLNIKIHKFLNKHIIANLLQNKFKKWENFIFFDLFGTKKFKIITNLIMLNKYYKLPLKKIKLYKTYKVQNKDYEFFLTQLGENFSIYYIFVPYIVLILFGRKIKTFQKFNLSMNDSINLYKFGKKWGLINTIFKCMFLDKEKNKIFLKLEPLENYKNELNFATKVKSNKNKNRFKIANLKNNLNSKSVKYKNFNSKYYNTKEKKENKMKTKYKDRIFEISIINFSLHTIKINSNISEDKYYIVPQNILNGIFSINDINKILNTNCKDISLMGKYIGENIKDILTAKESNNISEEQDMIDGADIINDPSKKDTPKREKSVKRQASLNPNVFNRVKTFQEIQHNNILEQEIKKEEIIENVNNKNRMKKKFSDKYTFPKGIVIKKKKKKRVSITNLNELKQRRFDNISRDIIRRRTLNLKNFQ